jgi:vacuolar-type H+-ATPase subunit H
MAKAKEEIKEIIHEFVADLVEAEVHFGEDGEEIADDIRVMRSGNSPDYETMLKDAVEELTDTIFDEIRGLLKEHAQFPEQWDTDKRLKEWLKEKGEL